MTSATGLPAGLLIQPTISVEALDEAVVAARAQGCFVAHSASSADENRFDLLRRLGRALGFPPWYRPNWDAFSDCLHDLSWLQPGPRLLVVDAAQSLRAIDDNSADMLVEILARACWYWATTDSPLTVLLAR